MNRGGKAVEHPAERLWSVCGKLAPSRRGPGSPQSIHSFPHPLRSPLWNLSPGSEKTRPAFPQIRSLYYYRRLLDV